MNADKIKNLLLIKINSLYKTIKIQKNSNITKDELIDFVLNELQEIINMSKQIK